jgi:hypothetical protein
MELMMTVSTRLYIAEGYRMEKPPLAPSSMNDLMIDPFPPLS